MACTCCEVGTCCNGAQCSSGTRSQCASSQGSFLTSPSGQECAAKPCIDNSGKLACALVNVCTCQSSGRSPVTTGITSCDCRNFLGNSACRWYYCEACDSSSGNCVSTCSYPRECCAGTCCALTQYCSAGSCVDKCSAGTTFCPGNGLSYQCCSSGQKCCGPDGCKPSTFVTRTVTISQIGTQWLDTGVNSDGVNPITWTASGTMTSNSASLNPQVTVGPDGWIFTADPGDISAGCRYVALIAKIGNNIFCLGTSGSGTYAAGRVYIAVYGGVSYNFSGSYTVTLSTGSDPCPNYTPQSVGEPVIVGESPAVGGPGTWLKAILKVFGIVASATCTCNGRAVQMDVWGEYECLRQFPVICGWLREEAGKRGLYCPWVAAGSLVLASVCLSALERPFRGNK